MEGGVVEGGVRTSVSAKCQDIGKPVQIEVSPPCQGGDLKVLPRGAFKSFKYYLDNRP